ncbi:Gic1p [Saccharomyces cerevisiae x Saccharomyces kudriavzevii VIN7]|uniref:Gic1p n=1 Tax=Saccharomyces cerevisiae x Saccharomyces kudriavzevii (strain VIN7) TaxID=1095631 RepID=H0GVR4_SACCK|nr:Gic1p [Saccharomyces cerevisiae x Saccharomyces kudriavzevii VIN7]
MTEEKWQQQMELPQMKSIWIDEDEEMEKLYGFQVRQRFMNGPSTNSDEDADEDLGIVLVDSEELALANKNNIKLPPLPNYMTINPNINSNHKFLTTKKKNFLGMFKKKDLLSMKHGSTKSSKQSNISAPFGFHHISHANGKKEDNSFGPHHEEEEQDDDVESLVNFTSLEPQPRPDSNVSSKYSNVVMNDSSRIVSSSTIATTMDSRNDSNDDNIPNKTKQVNSPTELEMTLEDLKKYTFPSVLGDGMSDKTNASSPSDSSFSNKFRPRDSSAVHPPELESNTVLDPSPNSPGSRISVDDVLKFYYQCSEASTPRNT